MSRPNFVVVALVALLSIGCMGSPTDVPVAGKLLVNGRPIENVLVKFHPAAAIEDGKSIAAGVTDADGRFVLTRDGGKSTGAIVGVNIVTLTEGPIPRNVQSSETPLAVESFMAGLEHRPLPVVFERYVDSTLRVEVKVGQGEYNLDIGDQR